MDSFCKFKKFGVLFSVVFAVLVSVFFVGEGVGVAVADAANETVTVKGLNATRKVSTLPKGTDGLAGVVGSVIGAVLSFVGVIFLVLMIYGGLLWMTAAGNDQNVTKAKDIIINSVIGLIIVVSAYAITVFVSSQIGVATTSV